MFTMKEIIDGMECFFVFKDHCRERMVERMICYEDVIEDCRRSYEDVFSLKDGEEVTLFNDSKEYMYCIAVESDDFYNTVIHVKTVIDNNAKVKKNKYVNLTK